MLAYAAVSAANQMLWLTFTPLTTDAARHYGVSSGAIGWLAEIFPLLYVVLAVPTGALIDRDLPRWLLVGAALTALGAVLRLADGYPAVLGGQVLIAVAQPLILNAVTKVSGAYLRVRDRPAGIAVSSAGIFAGMLLALLLGAAFGAAHIWPLLLVQAAASVAGVGWLGWALRRPGRFRAATAASAPLRTVWADPAIRLLTGLVCVGFGVFIALTTWLQVLLEPAGVSDASAGVLLLVMVLAGVLGSAALPAWLARRNAALRFVLLSVLVSAAGLVVLALRPGVAPGIPVLALIGLFLLTDLPIVLELAERRAGPAGGTASALVWLAGNAAGLVVALAVQGLQHRPQAAFVLLAAVLLAGIPLLRALAGRLRAPDIATSQAVRNV